MATRTKTIQYAFPMYTSVVADATTTNLAQITIYIPETVVSFQSVIVDIGFQDVITATGGTINEHRVGLRLGAAAYTTITETDDITHSGENIAGVIGPFDFTSHFTARWTGTSMTCDARVYFDQTTGTTLGMRNVTAMIYITYQYDDTATTHIKTVRIPLESLTGALTTTANSDIGSNQIPQLTSGGMLPESSVNIRNYFFAIESNESTSANTDYTITANIDSGSSYAFGVQEAALNSGRYCRWIYNLASPPDTTTTHNFQMWSSLAARLNHATITLYVTYEFNHTNSTSILNSIILPMELASPLGATTSAQASRFTRDFCVEEPGSITLRQSAFRMNYNAAATPTGLNLRAGSQNYRTYTTYGNMVCGMFCVQQRIDSGGSQGAGITLARGKNTIVIDGYMTITTNQITNINGYIILNYTSDKSTDGAGVHSHTIFNKIMDWDALLADRRRVDSVSVSISETYYWIISAGFVLYQMITTASQAITFDTECLSSEGKGGGYYEIYADAYQSDGDMSCSIVWMCGYDVYKRHLNDMDLNRVDIEQARGYRIFNSATGASGVLSSVTYHCHTFTVSGNVIGSLGGVVSINVYRSDNNEIIYKTTRVGDGAFSFTWYDDTISLYADAYEDSTHYARSANVTVGTSLDMNLNRAVTRAYA